MKIKHSIFPSETRKTKVKPGVTDPLDSGVLRCEDADASPIHPEVGGEGLTAGPVMAGLSADC